MEAFGIKEYSNEVLINKISELRKTERETISDLVLHLAEVDQRKLYRDLAYSSLYAYCTHGLGYSEGAAMRRIMAARCVRANPEVYLKLRDGRLSLCAVAELSRVINQEN